MSRLLQGFGGIKLWKVLASGLLLSSLMLTGVVTAGAASWSKGNQGDCSGSQPKGDVWINWSGYWIFDWGRAWNYLDWWNGSGWTAYGFADTGNIYGGTNTALAHTSAGFRAGLWSVTAVWSARFAPFSGGTQGPTYYNFNC